MFDAVPNDSTGYVFAAYMFFLLLILVYVGILGAKFIRINKEIGELTEEVEAGTVGLKPAGESREEPQAPPATTASPESRV